MIDLDASNARDNETLGDWQSPPAAFSLLFGNAKQRENGARNGEARAAALFVVDGEAADVKAVQAIPHSSIDRFTGGVRPGVLYTEEVAIGGTIKLEILVAKPSAQSNRRSALLLLRALRDLTSGRLAFGAKKPWLCHWLGNLERSSLGQRMEGVAMTYADLMRTVHSAYASHFANAGKQRWPSLELIALSCNKEPSLSPEQAMEVLRDHAPCPGWIRYRSALWSSKDGWCAGDPKDAGTPLAAEWTVDAGKSIHLRPDPDNPGCLVKWTYVERRLEGEHWRSGRTPCALPRGDRAGAPAAGSPEGRR